MTEFLMDPAPITIAAAAACELGENPVWDEQRQCVLWADISAGKILQWSISSGRYKSIYQGPPVGGFTLQENGDLLLFRVSDIALLRSDGHVSVLQPFTDEGATRFNDVIADPEGRVFAGTIGKTEESGGLYRVERDGSIRPLFSGTGCSNGMGFSPDCKTFYWTCSTTRQIFQFDYDQASGSLVNKRLFYRAEPGEGIPDGMAVDAEGCVWSARWGGACILRFSPAGQLRGRTDFPTPNITSLCFGGNDLDQLFVTSASTKQPPNPNAGALFQTRPPIPGRKVFKSRIR
ncbi:MAG TPA: SMP-30/gluconolactonase/LRE family protein, partial [Candidatus Saccharimonadales bacterium]|nr:SMP-30/gluconolactonase/LRE family protein [Candidatus Saccharimonadales bacterium]